MTIDDQGRVYVADATGQGVFVYATVVPGERGLDYLGFFGGEGVSNGAFHVPQRRRGRRTAVGSTWPTRATTASRCGATELAAGR